jgi:hypothetical protein
MVGNKHFAYSISEGWNHLSHLYTAQRWHPAWFILAELHDLVYEHLFFKSLPSVSVDIFFISVGIHPTHLSALVAYWGRWFLTKYQKLRKCYYTKWNFLYQITAASRSPFSLSSVLNWICWTPPPPEQNSWVRHWSALFYDLPISMSVICSCSTHFPSLLLLTLLL